MGDGTCSDPVRAPQLHTSGLTAYTFLSSLLKPDFVLTWLPPRAAQSWCELLQPPNEQQVEPCRVIGEPGVGMLKELLKKSLQISILTMCPCMGTCCFSREGSVLPWLGRPSHTVHSTPCLCCLQFGVNWDWFLLLV